VRDKGLPVVLISHNMPHVFGSPTASMWRDWGRRAAVLNPKKFSMSDAVAVITGATAPENIPAEWQA